MSTLPRQLEAILDVLGLEWSPLFDKNNKDAGENRGKVVGWLYRILDTLDSKTGHILRFTALLLTAHTFLANLVVGNRQTPHLISLIVLSLLVVPLATGVTALWVFKVSWLFFGNVRQPQEPSSLFFGHGRKIPKETTTEDRIKIELEDLAEICDKRVRRNRLSFFLCCSSVAVFLTTLGLAFWVVFEYGVSMQK